MPDRENREVQKPPQESPYRSLKHIFDKPPVEPRITEPDPDGSPATSGPKTPEESQEVLFREAAKKLAAEEEKVIKLGFEYARIQPKPLDIRDFDVVPGNNNTALVIKARGPFINDSSSKESSVNLEKGSHPWRQYLLKHFGVRVETDTNIAIFSSRYDPAMDATIGCITLYCFDSEGNYAKTGNYPRPILSKETKRGLLEMTPEDFEIAGAILSGMKQKLLAALGKTPPQTSDQSSNPPSDQ